MIKIRIKGIAGEIKGVAVCSKLKTPLSKGRKARLVSRTVAGKGVGRTPEQASRGRPVRAV